MTIETNKKLQTSNKKTQVINKDLSNKVILIPSKANKTPVL